MQAFHVAREPWSRRPRVRLRVYVCQPRKLIPSFATRRDSCEYIQLSFNASAVNRKCANDQSGLLFTDILNIINKILECLSNNGTSCSEIIDGYWEFNPSTPTLD